MCVVHLCVSVSFSVCVSSLISATNELNFTERVYASNAYSGIVVFYSTVCGAQNDRQLTVLPSLLKLIWSTEAGRETVKEMSAASRLV